MPPSWTGKRGGDRERGRADTNCHTTHLDFWSFARIARVKVPSVTVGLPPRIPRSDVCLVLERTSNLRALSPSNSSAVGEGAANLEAGALSNRAEQRGNTRSPASITLLAGKCECNEGKSEARYLLERVFGAPPCVVFVLSAHFTASFPELA